MGILIEGVAWPAKRPKIEAEDDSKCSTCILRARLEQAHVCLRAAEKILDVTPVPEEHSGSPH